jgi:hypothetical protein
VNKRALIFFAFVAFGLLAVSSTSKVTPVKGQSIEIGAQRVPNIEVDKNNFLYLTMAVATLPASAGTPGSQIFFTESTDSGKTWNNLPLTRNLSNTSIDGIGALNPRLALTKSGTVRAYLGYDDDTTGFRQAYFIRSKKNAKFQKPELLSEPGEGGFTPQVAVDSQGAVDVVWQASSGSGGEQTVFETSTDLGVTFGPRVVLSGSSSTAEAPSITIDQNNVIHVAWQDSSSGTSAILYCNSSDGGSTFSVPVQISTGVGPATQPEIAMDRIGGVNIIWVDQSTGAGQVAISRSTDAGGTFSAPIDITSARNADVNELAITSFSATTYVAYEDDNRSQVYLTQSQSNLLNFQSPVQVSKADPGNGEARSPSITVDSSGRLHMVWIDTSILGDQEGLLLYSNTTNGQSFSPPVEILAVLDAPH